ncbi:MAG: GyrI-like domain-containing protein [Coriobacteriia bacterium]|nr:GyrI-like domain-containing protein [Actinomycetota bacterium]MDZ4166512.1 GyrI-like domain-containing protein [Coriobacteriia bacterium]
MFEAEIKQSEAHTVVYLPMRGAYAQTPEGYGQLYGWIAQHGLTPAGMPTAVYLTMPSEVPESEALWELWAPVAGDAAEQEPDASGVGVRLVPAATVASTMHVGPYETVAPTYDALRTWIAAQGYRPTGPPIEVYYSDPATVAPEEYVTEIRIPIAAA